MKQLDWWHTIQLPDGTVTPGWWDLRATAAGMPWPSDLPGMRCLDVGTMDGFWAFEMERRGSQVSYRDVSVYDLRAEDIGTFDLVFAGYVLQMLRDPLRALDALHGVCRGSLIVLDTVSLPLELLPAPLARLNARRGQLEWFVFNRRGLRQAMTMMGFSVDAVTSVLRDHPGPAVTRQGLSLRTRLRHATGVLGRSAAVRGRA